MAEQVVQYVDRAMIGRKIEVGAYVDEQCVISGFGRLQSIESDKEETRFYFVGDSNQPTMTVPHKYEFLITWDPEERD